MGNYRNKLDIIADILHVVSQRAKKTQIMYQANLSHNALIKYLTEIIDAYLVNYESNERCYVLTSKGRRFLKKYQEYSRHNKHVEKQLNNAQEKRKILEELCSIG